MALLWIFQKIASGHLWWRMHLANWVRLACAPLLHQLELQVVLRAGIQQRSDQGAAAVHHLTTTACK